MPNSRKSQLSWLFTFYSTLTVLMCFVPNSGLERLNAERNICPAFPTGRSRGGGAVSSYPKSIA
jgi:hypothetical protein